jgi:methylisocitrate lyase
VTPLFPLEDLAAAGVSLALYPLSAFRAMAAAALRVYRAIREEGSQLGVVDRMQTRAELYDFLGYQEHERKLDELFAKEERDER